MKKKLIFSMILIEIILLMFLAQTIPSPQFEGKIESITYSTNRITIKLNNISSKIIIFEEKTLPLSKGEIIRVFGREEQYKKEKEIIADKIVKI